MLGRELEWEELELDPLGGGKKPVRGASRCWPSPSPAKTSVIGGNLLAVCVAGT